MERKVTEARNHPRDKAHPGHHQWIEKLKRSIRHAQDRRRKLYMTPREIAWEHRVALKTVYRLIEDGSLLVQWAGTRRYVRRSEVQRYFDRSKSVA
jgi:excisionase family DNA binding protein